MLVWKYLEFGACQTAIVQLSSLLFITSDGWGVKNSTPFCVSNGAVLLPTVRKPTGCLLEFFSETSAGNSSLFFSSTLLGRFHYFEGLRWQRRDV